MPAAPMLKAIRQEVDYNAKDLLHILNNKKFKDTFGTLWGDQLKIAPKGYPKDHPHIELLRYKSYVVFHELKDKQVSGEDFASHAASVFKTMKPFNEFLEKAVS